MADASGFTITARAAGGEPVGLTRASRASVDEPLDHRGGADESQTHTPITTPGIAGRIKGANTLRLPASSRSSGLAHRSWIAFAGTETPELLCGNPAPASQRDVIVMCKERW